MNYGAIEDIIVGRKPGPLFWEIQLKAKVRAINAAIANMVKAEMETRWEITLSTDSKDSG